MQRFLVRGLTYALALSPFFPIVAQSPAPVVAPILSGSAATGLPGSIAGSERWVVHLRERSFDLTEFRRAIVDRRPAAEVATIVAGLEASARADQDAFVRRAEALGVRVVTQWWLVNACVVELAPSQLDALRGLPGILFVQPDEPAEMHIRVATNASNHNSDFVNQSLGFRGVGVTVGVMDTGQDENMGGTGRPHRTYFIGGNPANQTGGGIGGSRLLVNRQIGALIADDQNGHGTGCASISAGANWGIATADDGHAPLAGIAGYAIANQVSGGASSNTTMASAWQAMATDRAQYTIVAANLSYGGSPNPLDVAQQALDSAALNADIMVCVAAGNASASTSGSQSGVNGLAVGAVSANSHAVASFSSRGPISGDTQRFYPDIAACGVSTVMAGRDNEGGSYNGSGTSMASPQVAGAATLLRGAFPTLSALDTKAMLLASTVDISQQNPSAPYNTRNAYGVGLLRDDRVFTMALAGQHGRGNVTTANPTFTTTLNVQAGKTYSIAIAWHRLVLNSNQWSDLNLEIVAGSTVVASSATPRNLYEMVRYFARTTGPVTLRVNAASLSGTSDQPFAFAWMESPNSPITGSFASYGAGCQGTGAAPAACMTANPNDPMSNNTGSAGITYALEVVAPQALLVEGFELKGASRTSGNVTVATQLRAADGSGQPGNILATGTMVLGPTGTFYGTQFATPVPIASGQKFFLSFVNANPTITVGTLNSGTNVPYWRNNGTGGSWIQITNRPWGYRVLCRSTGGATPSLAFTGVPNVGASYGTALAAAAANTTAVLLLGASNTTWNGIPLPADLSPLGANGCAIRAAGQILLTANVGANGAASLTIPIPNDSSIVGAQFFHQWAVQDAAANSFGFAFSNGGIASVGGTP